MTNKETTKEVTVKKSDLEFLRLRLEKLKTHLNKHIHDKIMKKALSKVEARILKLEKRKK